MQSLIYLFRLTEVEFSAGELHQIVDWEFLTFGKQSRNSNA
jgi:hypothetical protein